MTTALDTQQSVAWRVQESVVDTLQHRMDTLQHRMDTLQHRMTTISSNIKALQHLQVGADEEFLSVYKTPGATSNDQWKSSCGSDGKWKIYGSGEWKSCDSDGNDQSKSYCGSGTWKSSYGRDDKCQSYGSDGNDQWKGYYGKWESYDGNDQWKSYYGNDQWKSY